jgi:hypothetical protein
MINLTLTEPPVNTPSRAQRGKVLRAYSKAGILAGVDEKLIRRTVGAFLAAGIDPALSTSGALAKEIRANQVALLGAVVNAAAEDLFADPKAATAGEVHVNTPRWDVNQKFDFLGKLVHLVITEVNPSCVILGDGGLGKTYTVKQQLTRAGFKEGIDFEFFSGTATAAGLYRLLYENNGKLIVFDDCDAVLKDPTAVNVLKAALDSFDVRKVSWISSLRVDGLPQSFEFTGRIIFISNLGMDRIPEPIVSRSISIDLTMNAEEKLDRMEALLPTLEPNVVLAEKAEVLALLKAHRAAIKNLNLRTLIKAIRIRKTYGAQTDANGELIWRELALFAILS